MECDFGGVDQGDCIGEGGHFEQNQGGTAGRQKKRDVTVFGAVGGEGDEGTEKKALSVRPT